MTTLEELQLNFDRWLLRRFKGQVLHQEHWTKRFIYAHMGNYKWFRLNRVTQQIQHEVETTVLYDPNTRTIRRSSGEEDCCDVEV